MNYLLATAIASVPSRLVTQAFVPPAQPMVLAELHAGIWWGALLIVLGGAYCYGFWPGRQKRE